MKKKAAERKLTLEELDGLKFEVKEVPYSVIQNETLLKSKVKIKILALMNESFRGLAPDTCFEMPAFIGSKNLIDRYLMLLKKDNPAFKIKARQVFDEQNKFVGVRVWKLEKHK